MSGSKRSPGRFRPIAQLALERPDLLEAAVDSFWLAMGFAVVCHCTECCESREHGALLALQAAEDGRLRVAAEERRE